MEYIINKYKDMLYIILELIESNNNRNFNFNKKIKVKTETIFNDIFNKLNTDTKNNINKIREFNYNASIKELNDNFLDYVRNLSVLKFNNLIITPTVNNLSYKNNSIKIFNPSNLIITNKYGYIPSNSNNNNNTDMESEDNDQNNHNNNKKKDKRRFQFILEFKNDITEINNKTYINGVDITVLDYDKIISIPNKLKNLISELKEINAIKEIIGFKHVFVNSFIYVYLKLKVKLNLYNSIYKENISQFKYNKKNGMKESLKNLFNEFKIEL